MRFRPTSRATRGLLLVAFAAVQGVLLAGCCTIKSIRTSTLPDGVVGQVYSIELEHNCSGKSSLDPVMWRMTGDIPPGLTFSESGRISGMPRVAGTFSVAVALTRFGSSGFDNDELVDLKPFSITIRPA